MELLVVLTMVSMVSVLLLESTTFLFGNYSRVQSHLVEIGNDRLPDRWYRNSIASLVAASDPENAFTGSSNSFQGYTLSPVTSRDGTLTHVRWYLEQERNFMTLNVVQNGAESIEINRWQASGAAFSYINGQAASQKEWGLNAAGEPILPRAIKLTIDQGNRQTIEVLAKG